MAYKLIKVGNSYNIPIKEYAVDTLDELDLLKANFGDKAFVGEDGCTYIKGTEDWVKFSTGGGGGNVTIEEQARIMADLNIHMPDDATADNHLYRIDYSNVPYDYYEGNKYMEEHGTVQLGGCSSFRKDNWIGRNYDWYYNDAAVFILRTSAIEGRNATFGMASYAPITNEVAQSRQFVEEFRYLPFHTLDGMNDKGVYCNTNVTAFGDRGTTTGTNPGKDRLCGNMVTRYVLDYAQSAAHAIQLLQEVDIWAVTSGETPEEFHFMISDKDETYIVECVNNSLVWTKCEDEGGAPAAIMTNFCLANQDGTEWYDGTHTTIGSGDEGEFFLPTEHPQGVERFDTLKNQIANVSDKETAVAAIEAVKYSQAYTLTDNHWYSEFLGRYVVPEEGIDVDLNWGVDPQSEISQTINALAKELYDEGQAQGIRDGKSWFSVHTTIYDVEDKKAYLYTQEDYEKEFEFTLNTQSSGGGTSDYTALTNKPKINNVELNGNKSLADLGISNAWENGEGEYSAKLAGSASTAVGDYSVAEGYYTHAKADASHTEGWNSIVVEGADAAHAEGENTTAGGEYSHAEGYETKTNNTAEHAEGQNNKSNKASDTWGNAGNTLSSIGIGLPGVVEEAKNAVEVMQNGDLYLYGVGDYDGTNPQDADTVQTLIDNINDTLEDKQDTLIAGENITIENNVISATGGGGGGESLTDNQMISILEAADLMHAVYVEENDGRYYLGYGDNGFDTILIF